MATTEAALVSLLVQGGVGNPVFALVGSRVYPLTLPQTPTYPAIRYQRIDTQRAQYRMMGTGRAAYAKPRFQIDCYGITPATAQAVADAVRARLDGFAGLVSGVGIGSTATEDEASDIEPGVGPGGSAIFRHRLDFLIGHQEA
jgi:hypothetical protein